MFVSDKLVPAKTTVNLHSLLSTTLHVCLHFFDDNHIWVICVRHWGILFFNRLIISPLTGLKIIFRLRSLFSSGFWIHSNECVHLAVELCDPVLTQLYIGHETFSGELGIPPSILRNSKVKLGHSIFFILLLLLNIVTLENLRVQLFTFCHIVCKGLKHIWSCVSRLIGYRLVQCFGKEGIMLSPTSYNDT